MAASQEQQRERIVACLVAGHSALDSFAGSIRYLQVGLAGEAIDAVMVLPDHRQTAALTSGPFAVVNYAAPSWLFARRGWRQVVSGVKARIDALRHDGPVVVHALDLSALPLALELVDATGGELAVTVSSSHDLDEPAIARALMEAGAIVTASEALNVRLDGRHAPDARMRTIGFGVALADEPAAFREQLRARTLIYMGPLRGECGGELLLRAAKRVSRHHPDLLIFMVGKGPAEAIWRRTADALDMRAGVIFTGNIDNWRTALTGADIFCVPYAPAEVREEPLQALADGLAVVASNGSVYDCFHHEDTAMVFQAGDEDALADALRRLLDDPALARRLGARAQAHARDSHSVGYMVDAHVQVYEALTAHRRTIAIGSDV